MGLKVLLRLRLVVLLLLDRGPRRRERLIARQ